MELSLKEMEKNVETIIKEKGSSPKS